MSVEQISGTPVGVSDGLLRLSIGLEDCDEPIADLVQALAGEAGAHGVLRGIPRDLVGAPGYVVVLLTTYMA